VIKYLSKSVVLAVVLISTTQSYGQGTEFPFSGLKQDATLPVEIAADQLAVNQADGTATFSGNVVIGQGEMRLSAELVRVEYAKTEEGQAGKIARLFASGHVVLVNGGENAEADEAVYTIDSAAITMTGNVLLTQGGSAISGQKLIVNLKTGTGTMEGRIRTILQQGGN
jgi:lipopolysaccharide export system protein LptA